MMVCFFSVGGGHGWLAGWLSVCLEGGCGPDAREKNELPTRWLDGREGGGGRRGAAVVVVGRHVCACMRADSLLCSLFFAPHFPFPAAMAMVRDGRFILLCDE